MCARMKKPAYGLNDAPRKWWNVVDSKLVSYGFKPTRADRCYVLYGDKKKQQHSQQHGSRERSGQINTIADVEQAMEYLLDPISGSAAKNKEVLVIICLHVDDLFLTGDSQALDKVLASIRKDFKVGSEDNDDIQFCGQRVKWIGKGSTRSDPKETYLRRPKPVC